MPLTSASLQQSVNFGNIATAGTGYRTLSDATPATAVALAFDLSETRAYRLARGILQTVPDRPAYVAETGGLIDWAKGAGSEQRQTIARAIRNDGGRAGNLFLVHRISGMTRQDARPYMKDYFASGGELSDVAIYLAGAGRVLRRHRGKADGTAGAVVDAVGGAISDGVEFVGDLVEDGVDAVIEGVSSVVDAIVDAGRSLGEFIGEVVSWSVQQVADLVEALLEAGQSLFQILEAAVEAGAELVTKMVKAMVDVGKAVGEVLVEGLKFAASTLNTVVDALLRAGQAVVDIVSWAAGEAIAITTRVVESLIAAGRSVVQIVRSVVNLAGSILRATVEALLAIGQTVGQLLVTAITEPGNFFRNVVEALNDIGTSLTELFDAVRGAVADGVRQMAAALTDIGRNLLDLASWAVDRGADILRDVVRGILDAGRAVVDVFTAIAAEAVDFVADVIQALVDIGRAVTDLIRETISIGIEFTRKFFTALTELADGLVRFATEIARRTYAAVEDFVGALIDAGLTVAEIMATTVSGTYWMFRRMVNAIIRRTGRFGEVLDWVLTQAEDSVTELWEDALQAARFGGQRILDAVAWAVDRADDALDAILNAWETMGENLIDFYEEAARLARSGTDAVFERIAEATVRLENSVLYALKYLEKDFLPGMADFVKGALAAGYELAELVIDLASLTAQGAIRGFRALLDLGQSLGDLLVATMRNPEDLLANLLAALDEADRTLEELYRVVIHETGGQYEQAVTQTLRDLERPIGEMLDAALEVGFGAVDTVLATLLSNLASYRPMTAAEIATARLVYGDTFDYDRIYFSQESLSNDILFEVQSWWESSSRAFVTNTLVNFDASGGGTLDDDTMIHELCHVWQFQDTGPFYMAEAVHAQQWGAGYNYGYTDDRAGKDTGSGGEVSLTQVFVDHPGLTDREVFETFNREQQAEIVMHYYVRRHASTPSLDFQPWLPFRNVVHT